jgi:hypothetical protein
MQRGEIVRRGPGAEMALPEVKALVAI